MKLAFREYGSGQPLIILHGLFGQSDNWNTLAKQFSEKGLRVFTVDQRNHGLSPHSDTMTFQALGNDIMDFINEHQLKDPILLGHSMGGKAVLYFQQQHPCVAKKLIIADIATRSYPPHHQEVLEALNAVDFGKIHNRKEAEAILSKHIADAGTRQFLLKNIYWRDQDEGILDWRFNLAVITKDYEAVTKSVPFYTSDVPLLVVRGEKSKYINEQDIEEYKKRFANSKFVTIPGAGHWVHAEKPAEFFEAVTEFIVS